MSENDYIKFLDEKLDSSFVKVPATLSVDDISNIFSAFKQLMLEAYRQGYSDAEAEIGAEMGL